MGSRLLCVVLCCAAMSLGSPDSIAAADTPDLSVATDVANAADPRAPNGLSSLAFLIGDWDLSTTILIKGEQTRTVAKLRGRYAMGGFAVAIEEVHPALGIPEVPIFVSTQFFAIKPQTGAIVGISHNTLGNRKLLEASFDDGRLVIVAHGEMFKGAKVINRTTYTNIRSDGFEIGNEVSSDEGLTWKNGGYSAIATRVAQ
jgi:hypothetical protein